mmetsp:Transcript_39404/g.64538  ORF Transcript_39404/g.64538 Transcript_39404/m.64538 type:complete len:85 (+) Transcript_39404:218-472(+)
MGRNGLYSHDSSNGNSLEQNGDSNVMDVQRKDAMAKYGDVVIFGSSRGLKRQISTIRFVAINSAIGEERYNICYQKAMILKLAK